MKRTSRANRSTDAIVIADAPGWKQLADGLDGVRQIIEASAFGTGIHDHQGIREGHALAGRRRRKGVRLAFVVDRTTGTAVVFAGSRPEP